MTKMNRRQFLSSVGYGAGWLGFWAALGGSALASFKYMIPSVLYEPPTTFKIGRIEDFGMGVTDRLKKERQLWVVRDTDGLYAMVSICRHLGCTPNWLGDQQQFFCPCHGSIYDISGNVLGGPAPRVLWRPAVRIDPTDGQIVVSFLERQDPEPVSTPGGLIVDEKIHRVEPFFLKV